MDDQPRESPMHWKIETLSLTKAGNDPSDYEDATSHAFSEDDNSLYAAISDGASDGFESRLWAKALVDAFAHHPIMPDESTLQEWLDSPAQSWHDAIQWQNLKWYHQEKARSGAFATLLGLIFNEGRWQAWAVGDACLFQIRNDELVLAFPMTESRQFDTSPPLLSTQARYNKKILDGLIVSSGTYEPSDLFFVMTDAMAHWFLVEIEADSKPWQELEAFDGECFPSWVEHLRQKKLIRNDDVTVMMLEPSIPSSVQRIQTVPDLPNDAS